MDDALWVVMPVYNEDHAVESVLREWTAAARAVVPGVTVCVVDDGSTDETPAVLARLAAEQPGLRIIRQPNAGHGQACMTAYRAALDGSADWVLQVDSDGQCDARYFGLLWAAGREAPAVLGRRRHREDGLARALISRVLTVVVLAATGRWVRDANTPYRLMRADVLAAALPRIPAGVSLVNVLLALDLAAHTTIRWVDVGFRARPRPAAHGRRYFLRHAHGLWRDLRRYRRASSAIRES
jgi:dolichol-phosphate mannosyltransferase